jgi:hypothetical protein
MATLEDVSRLVFTVETLYTQDNKSLGVLRPDENGYYDTPLAALGIPSRNNTYYYVKNFLDSMTNKDSPINIMLTGGNLYGEWGHPMRTDYPDDDTFLQRLRIIDEKKYSHHIKSVYTGDTLENGGKLVRGLVKPYGPYGHCVEQNFAERFMNTSFSLRAIVDQQIKNNLAMRTIKSLYTFDAVGVGGYAEASKRFSGATESLERMDIKLSLDTITTTEFGLECFTQSEINDLMKSKKVIVGKTTVNLIKVNDSYRSEDKARSIFTEAMKLTRR